MKRQWQRGAALAVALAVLAGCQPAIPKEALQLSPESLAERQIQMRRFDTANEKKVLAASAAVLQDLGFQLDESETDLGLVVGSKIRSAVNAGQIVGAVVLAALTGAIIPTDRQQKMRASLVTCPVGEDGGSIAVRVTFQRIVWNDKGQVSKLEGLKDPEIYQEFFAKLSKSLFLEANEL